MEPTAFADRFEAAFRQIYGLAVRRVRDKREGLGPASIAFLTHLAAAGPMTLSEIARHVDRAQSTVSEMVDHLCEKGLLRRETDPSDLRRTLIWLTAEGRARLAEEMSVLSAGRLEAAAADMAPADREALVRLADELIERLKTTGERK